MGGINKEFNILKTSFIYNACDIIYIDIKNKKKDLR